MKKVFLLSFLLTAISGFSQKKWTLQEAVDYAVKNNLQVVQNDYSRQLQEKNLQMAKREYLPSVSANIGNNASFGQAQDVFGSIRRNDNFNNSANVSSNILLYNNGRLEKTVRRSEYDLQASIYDVETIKNNISLQVAQQYLSVLLNKEIVQISQSALENADRLYKRAKITTDVGTTPLTVQYEAEANLARERQNLQNATINVERSLFALAQLLRLDDYRNFDVADVPLSGAIETPLAEVQDFIERAYEQQPQLKAADFRIKAAEAQTEIIKTQFWPTITASAGLGTFYFNSLTMGGEENVFKQYGDNFSQQLGVNANIPIFNKGITKLQVEQSKINELVAKNTLEQQKQDVRQSVQKAAFDANANYQTYLAAVQAERSTRLAFEFAEKSYQAGRTTIYDLNTARNNLANAEGAIAQAKYNYIFSLKLLNFYAGIPLSL